VAERALHGVKRQQFHDGNKTIKQKEFHQQKFKWLGGGGLMLLDNATTHYMGVPFTMYKIY
jgi:hypothetical protein